jgi:methylmalonyl-CoA/ethylmalonyl-CoA epimerase
MKIAHIGFVVKEIEKSLPSWLASGYELQIKKTFDPIQNVFCLILKKVGEPDIELVAPAEEGKSPLTSRLERGGGIDHICFYTTNMKDSLLDERAKGSLIVCEPVFAETFGKQIAFVVRRGGLLIEYLEE